MLKRKIKVVSKEEKNRLKEYWILIQITREIPRNNQTKINNSKTMKKMMKMRTKSKMKMKINKRYKMKKRSSQTANKKMMTKISINSNT